MNVPLTRRGLVALSTVVALALTGCSTSTSSEKDGSPSSTSAGPGEQKSSGSFSGRRLSDDNHWVPSSTPLTDTDGEQRTLSDYDADVTLVFFGYTHCPDICGIVMSTIASAVSKLDAADADRVQVVFVTTDPARDDESALRTYLDRYNPSFHGLTGDLDDVSEVAKALKVVIEEGEKLPSGGYEVVHSDQVFGLNADHEASVIWTRETSPAKLAADIETLLAG